MGELFRRFHASRSKSGRIWVSILILVLALLFLLVVHVIRSSGPRAAAPVVFSPDSVLRVLQVSCVYKIEPDPAAAGALWFATAQGLHRMGPDGGWTRYGLDQGLPSERVYDACFSGGALWAATRSGCCRLDPVTGRFRPVRKATPESGALSCVLVEDAGEAGVFFANDGGGLFRAAHPDSTPVQVMIPDRNTQIRITCLKNIGDTLYIGQEDGFLYAYDPAPGSFKRYFFSNQRMSDTYIWDVAFFGKNLWAATSDHGIFRARDEGGDTLFRVEDFPARGAFAFAPEENGLWCGSPSGLWRYHEKEKVWIQFVHPDEKKPMDFQVLALHNRPDRLWYGTLENGIGYLVKKNVEWVSAFPTLSQPNVAALIAADSLLWTAGGYQGNTADLFNARTLRKIRRYDPVDDNIMEAQIQCFALSGEALYYGGYAGFGYIRLDGRDFNHFSSKSHPFAADIAAISLDGDPFHYLGGAFGIVAFDPRVDSIRPLSGTEHYRITCLERLGDSLMFGTLSHGAGVVGLKTGVVHETGPDTRSRVVGIAALADGAGKRYVFMATREEGCYRLDPATGRSSRLDPPAEVLPGGWGREDNHLLAFRRIGGSVWLGTRFAGILVWDAGTGKWKTLDRTQGLVSDQVRCFYDDGNYVWVGAYGGFTRLDKRYVEGLLRNPIRR